MVNLLGQHVEYTLNMWTKPEFSDAKLHLIWERGDASQSKSWAFNIHERF